VPLQRTFSNSSAPPESDFLPTPITRHLRPELSNLSLDRSNSAGSVASRRPTLGVPIPVPHVTPEEEEEYQARRKSSLDSAYMLSMAHPDEAVARTLRQSVGNLMVNDRFSLEIHASRGGLPPPPRPRNSPSPGPSRQASPEPFAQSDRVPQTPTMLQSPSTPFTTVPLTPIGHGPGIVSMYGSMSESSYTTSPTESIPEMPQPVYQSVTPSSGFGQIRPLP
jgi:hypothetical protein